MLKEFVEKLLSLAPVTEIEVEGLKYTDKAIHPVQRPLAANVGVSTLSGLTDLVNAELEALDKKAAFFHVVNFDKVLLTMKESDEWGRRQLYIKAELPETRGFIFGSFLDHENFIIGVQANFTNAGDRDYVLKIASAITNEQVSTSSDDGISQNVALKAGVTLKTSETLRSRVTLAPFRTFREVEQPSSEFVFRVKQTGTGTPTLALFEADGGKWKLDAMETIARYLRAAGTDIPVIS